MKVYPTAFGIPRETPTDAKEQAHIESIPTNWDIDLKLIPQRTDYTEAFDAFTYNYDEFNPRFAEKLSLHNSEQKNELSVPPGNTELLLQLQESRNEIAELKHKNETMVDLLADLKSEHYADFQVVVDACNENFIPIERDGKEIPLAQLLRLLLQSFRVEGVAFKTEDVVYRCRDESALLRRLTEKDAEIESLKDEIQALEKHQAICDTELSRVECELRAAENREQELTLEILEFEAREVSNQKRDDCLALEEIENAGVNEFKSEFQEFSRAIFNIARTLDLPPDLSVPDTIWHINSKILELKMATLAPVTKFEHTDDFVSYVDDVLQLRQLELCGDQISKLEYNSNQEETNAIIDKIAAGMRFSGDRVNILQEVWEHLLNE